MNVRVLKLITGVLELFLGIPVLGGMVVIGLLYSPLVIMLVLHIITVVLAIRSNTNATGNTIGIVTSLLAWIPFLGMILHIVTGIFLLTEALRENNKQ